MWLADFAWWPLGLRHGLILAIPAAIAARKTKAAAIAQIRRPDADEDGQRIAGLTQIGGESGKGNGPLDYALDKGNFALLVGGAEDAKTLQAAVGVELDLHRRSLNAFATRVILNEGRTLIQFLHQRIEVHLQAEALDCLPAASLPTAFCFFRTRLLPADVAGRGHGIAGQILAGTWRSGLGGAARQSVEKLIHIVFFSAAPGLGRGCWQMRGRFAGFPDAVQAFAGSQHLAFRLFDDGAGQGGVLAGGGQAGLQRDAWRWPFWRGRRDRDQQ